MTLIPLLIGEIVHVALVLFGVVFFIVCAIVILVVLFWRSIWTEWDGADINWETGEPDDAGLPYVFPNKPVYPYGQPQADFYER